MSNYSNPALSYYANETKKKLVRQSNIELLRITAMLLVVIVHINGAIEPLLDNHSIQTLLWSFTQSLSICCVDIFVLISGWFGIRPTIKGVGSFIFQIFFFLVIDFTIASSLGIGSFHGGGIIPYFTCLSIDWFSKSYLLLLVLSPILNSFIESTDKKRFLTILGGFFCIQTYWGWYWNCCDFFNNGYSTISFIGLYLLAAYCRKYMSSISTRFIIFIIISVTIINGSSSYLFDPLGNTWTLLLMSYINPLVIITSLGLVVIFSRLSFNNAFINWIASSCYAVYLLHVNGFLFNTFKDYSCHIFLENNGISFLGKMFLFIATIFIMSILLDKFRIFIWRYLIKIF